MASATSFSHAPATPDSPDSDVDWWEKDFESDVTNTKIKTQSVQPIQPVLHTLPSPTLPSLPKKVITSASHRSKDGEDDEDGEDAESSDELSDSDDDIVQGDSADLIAKKKKSKSKRLHDLVEFLYTIISSNRSLIDKQTYSITKYGKTRANLTGQEYNIDGYGNFFILLLKVQAYFQSRGHLKVNLSKLRADLSDTRTKLRIAAHQNDVALVIKLKERVDEMEKQMKTAEENVTKSKEKNPDFEKVKNAIHIMKRGNARTMQFTSMFRNRVMGIKNDDDTICHVETKTVTISKEEQSKAKSLFSKSLFSKNLKL